VTALLKLTDVVASYGPVKALHGISLTVEEGAIVAVLGANGAGKTTTLRAISHTVRTGGEIRFAGRSLARHGPESIAALGIAHVPEGRGLFPELTIVENLKLGAYVRRGSVKTDLERVYEYFPWMGRRRSELAGSLSGGEQQMLALAKAFMQQPRLLLLDEPSLGLAPLVVAQFFQLVRRLNEEQGLTVLLVEQNANAALELANRAYLLEVGHVVLEGASAELREHEGVRKSYLGY
jgi:branched-chain amino acid transport system ATP-binding protein